MEKVKTTLAEVFADRARNERIIAWRFPWFNVVYNWAVALLIVGFAVSCVVWSVDIKTERVASERAATAMAEYQAALQAEEEAKAAELAAARSSVENIMKNEATAVAKAFYGIRNFVDKYHYSESDLETYARCIFNRVDYSGGVSSVEEILATPEQFLAYSEKNTVLDEYYQMAYKFVEAWHTEQTKPCDSGYRWAELTPQGVYLTNEFGAGPYARRWQA